MRLQRITLIVIVLVLSIPCWANQLQIVHFDIGQGDATLIWSPSGQTMLVDAGWASEPDDIRLWMQSHGINDLTYTLATHYHADHIGEFLDLYNSGYLPDIAYDRGDNPGYTTQTYYNYIAAAAPVRQTIAPGEIVDLGGGVTATAVCVQGNLMNGQSISIPTSSSYENERSICLLVEYHNFRYVVSGDLRGSGSYELESLCSGIIGDIDVFEVNHHGSYSSTSNTWLNNLQAEAAVVSLSDNNSYGYVHTEVISRVNSNYYLQTFYHTEEGHNLSTKSVVVNDHVILETNGLTSYTIDGDLYDLGPDIFVDVWVDPMTALPIPTSGGTLFWNLMVQNLETSTIPVNIKFWLEVPNYGPYTMIDLPGFDLPPLPTGAERERQIDIPSGAPAGMYELIGEITDEDDLILYACDRDTFYKEGTDGGDWFGYLNPYGSSDFQMDSDVSQRRSAAIISAYPMPFNPEVTIGFSLAEMGMVQLDVFDLGGRKVATLYEGNLSQGVYYFDWNAQSQPTGVYFARLTGDGVNSIKKLVYLK
ncbi:hypothetical protein CEE37_01815 [candidate division LCP-89 bacterium B3_LCP]|uniref:Metallo-beta-lactamase domain-containing protein n=1 Tax=candidate division LCP-89 bacterium B3_LCP TaxID=2012998 RepID=A0A532V5F9_UNCL8|nr:MAG: hypothetical protein CEE37_01815 [candidate division LCP-89 bacterium B3_LCP]